MRPPGKRWPGRENRLIRETLAAWAAALRDFPLPALRRSCLWGKSKKDICRGRAQCSGPGSSNKRIRSWLRTIYPYSLARESGCPLERIFVVPGNHDIDRSRIDGSRQIRNIHKAIKDAAPAYRYRELQAQLTDAATGRALFEPLAAYNEFAAHFNCQVFHERLAWKQDLDLAPGMTLRIHGFTSTLLSGAVTQDGQDDKQLSLYLSPWQTGLLDPDPNVVNLVMGHHPPDWLMDQDEVEDAVHGRAAIHLWGHKHRQRINKDDQYIRLAAGAVNPDAGEPGWHPAYNLIELSVQGSGPARALHVTAHLLEWQTNPERYRARQDSQGQAIFQHLIHCPGDEHPTPPAPAAPSAGPALEGVAAVAAQAPDVEAAMGETSTRHLVIRWWGLPMAARREIALRLGLISEDEVSLPEPERYARALLRAKERNQLEQVAEEINKWPT
jgi:predicted phosphodiesterase